MREFAIFYLADNYGQNYCLHEIESGHIYKEKMSITRHNSIRELGDIIKKTFRELPTDSRPAQVHI